MKARSKSEWFELDKPIGEPKIAETWKDDSYWIERITRNNGEVVWFGQGTNWVKASGSNQWTYLGTDYSVKEIEPGVYPEERNIWIECEEPIYETLYKNLNNVD